MSWCCVYNLLLLTPNVKKKNSYWRLNVFFLSGQKDQ